MPYLAHLDGYAQTWAELHERNRVYWATHDRDGTRTVIVRKRSYFCLHGPAGHVMCSGNRGARGRYHCECECHEAA